MNRDAYVRKILRTNEIKVIINYVLRLDAF